MIPKWIEHRTSPEFIAEVIRYMKNKHFGIANAAKKDQLIVDLFGIDHGHGEFANTERLLRRAIELANQEHGALIVSDTTNGYWWASGLKDGLEPAEKNMSRALTILDNAKKLVDNLKDQYGGQIGLGL
jgi:hypothetical protein